MKPYTLKFQIVVFTLVPLACLVVLSVVLLMQMNQVIESVEDETRSWKHVNTGYKLESEVIEAFCELRTSTTDDGLVDRTESLKRFAQTKKTLADIVRTYQDSPEKLKLAQAVQDFWIYKGEPFIDWFLDAQSHGELHWKRVNNDFPFRLVALCDEFLTKFTTLIRAEKNTIAASAVSERWERFQQLPYLAIAVSVLFGILQATALAITIKRPLTRIQENCRRMATDEQLLPALTGRDELSGLDRLFHNMAHSVRGTLDGEKAMIENARDLICSLSADGAFLKANRSCSSLLGYSQEDLLTKSLLDICRPEDTVKADDEIRTSVERNDMRTFELTLLRTDGSPVDTRWSCVWSERDDALFALVRDITEEKNIERLKQDFVDMISHDLRSPLTSMLGSLGMIEQGAKGPLPAEAQTEIESAVRNVEQLVDFINDLLDFQKLKSGRMQLERVHFELQDLIDSAIEAVKSDAKEKAISLVLPDASTTIYGDRNKLQQLVANLLTNAICHAPSGSAVELVAVWTSSTVEIRVIDSGPGVPIEYREQIFDAFFEVPSQKSKEGTGLGLAICKLIVDAHGGKIGVSGTSLHDVQSQTGKIERQSAEPFAKPVVAEDSSKSPEKTGSIFWFTLPRS